jgi:uncharacterized membrane protein YphA (DoxX/SURF4 family)
MQTIDLQNTRTAIRLLLGLLFLSTGVMKFIVPDLRAAFSGQLTAAGIPFHSLSMWIVPGAEIGLGALFILGVLLRLASFSAIVMMLVATYVHVVVDNPALFPLQPEADHPDHCHRPLPLSLVGRRWIAEPWPSRCASVQKATIERQ